MALFTLDWSPASNGQFFRRHELYTMSWAECVWSERALVLAASDGGAVFVCRDVEDNNVPIAIYNAAGHSLGLLKWGGRLVGAGWSCEEMIVLVESGALVSVHDMFGSRVKTFSLGAAVNQLTRHGLFENGQELKKLCIVRAELFHHNQDTGLAVLGGNNRFFIISSIHESNITTKKLSDPFGGSAVVQCWTAVADRYKAFIVAASGMDIFILEPDCKHQSVRVGSLSHVSPAPDTILQLSVSPSARLLAALTNTCHVLVCSLDATCPRAVVPLPSTCTAALSSSSRSLYWCGVDTVAVDCRNSVVLVMTSDDSELTSDMTSDMTSAAQSITLPLDSDMHQLCSDAHCLRIITPYNYEIIEQVSSETVAVFRIGSMHPAAVLLEAYREFQKESHKADEYLRMIMDKLPEAISTCVEAASLQHVPHVQKLLLKAAQYGRSFAPLTDSQQYETVCRYLRVLNSLRHHEHGLAVMFQQLSDSSVDSLLERLMRRRLFFVAVSVSRYLAVPAVQGHVAVLQRWAEHTVLTSGGDDGNYTLRLITSELIGGGATTSGGNLVAATVARSGLCFADLARAAIKASKKQTAIELLSVENDACRAVPLFIELRLWDEAVQCACDSHRPDLVYSAVHQLRNSLSRGQFQMLVHKYPLVRSLYGKYLRMSGQMELLRDLLLQEDDFSGQARLKLLEAQQEQRVELRTQYLAAAQDMFKKARNESMSSSCEEQIKLIKCQLSLESSGVDNCVGLSLYDTVHLLIMLNKNKLADALKQEHKIPDSRWWWIKVQALSSSSHWQELEKFAKSKKSPIGYEPFVDACLDNKNNLTEARKYVTRVSADNKVKYLCKVCDYEGAARAACDRRSLAELCMVELQCSAAGGATGTQCHTQLLTAIGRMKSSIGGA